MTTLFFREPGQGGSQYQKRGRQRARVLVQGGQWVVPVDQRPAGWENIAVPEGCGQDAASASGFQNGASEREGRDSGMKSEIDFASDNADRKRAGIDALAGQIAALRAREADSIYEIGRTLTLAKAEIPHGEWLTFLEDTRVAYTARTAQMLMKIASAEDGRDLSRYGVAKAVALLRLIPTDRKQLCLEVNVNLLTVSELYVRIWAILGESEEHGPAIGRGHCGGEPTTGVEVAWAAGVLHLPLEGFSEEAIEQAFRELAQLFHPDHGVTNNSKYMRDLLAARETLKERGAERRAQAA